MKKYDLVTHTFPPIFDKDSKILILGSIPSIKSREANIYFGNPKNRFWKIISIILDAPYPKSNQEKIDLVLKNNIALWDVLESCEIYRSSDSTIKNPKINDFNVIFNVADIKAVFTIGKTAYNLFNRYTKQTAIYLPSTSPANCAISEEYLIKEFSKILDYIK